MTRAGRNVLAIDPGNIDSAFAWIDVETRKSLWHEKLPNDTVAKFLRANAAEINHVVIEMVASYGMAVGQEVFETCVWIGRFEQLARELGITVERIVRLKVKLHHCHVASAKDGNIIQALVDRFAPGAPNRGKGTKSQPGWFHGFKADIWQAYALAVYAADQAQP
jgi:hypothetical protein